MHSKKPFFRYGVDGYFYPGHTMEDVTVTPTVERHDRIAGSGKKASYYVGSRDFLQFSFKDLTDAEKTSMETFWDTVKDGDPFWIVFDDSARKFGDGTLFGDGYVVGDDIDGDAITSTQYTVESMELPFTPMETYGYWQTTMKVREVV